MYYIKRNLAFFALLCCPLFTIGVNAQIGINTTEPSGGTILDIHSGGNKGLLIPRVDIADLGTIDPVTGGSPKGLLVYNTNITTGEGFYYWSGRAWEGYAGPGIEDKTWSLSGNSETDPNADYIGTADGQPLIFAVNAAEKMRITQKGAVSIKEFIHLDPRDAAPASPQEGDVYYDDGENKIKVYTGASWEALN